MKSSVYSNMVLYLGTYISSNSLQHYWHLRYKSIDFVTYCMSCLWSLPVLYHCFRIHSFWMWQWRLELFHFVDRLFRHLTNLKRNYKNSRKKPNTYSLYGTASVSNLATVRHEKLKQHRCSSFPAVSILLCNSTVLIFAVLVVWCRLCRR